MKGEIISLFKHKKATDFFTTKEYVKKELGAIGLSFYSYPLMNEQLVLDIDILETALSRSDVVIILSPIDTAADDKIKKLLSAKFNLPLERDFKTMEHLEKSFRRNRLDVPPSAMSLSFFPKGSYVFDNKRGLQNGYGFEKDGKIIICLPDEELQIRQMYDDDIFGFINAFSGFSVDERSVGIYGLTAGFVRAQLALKFKQKGSIISVSEGIDDTVIRVTAVSDTINRAKETTYKSVKSIMEIFGDYVYGIDIKDNAQAAVNELLCKGLEISIADGYTRSELKNRLVETDGARETLIDYSSFGTSPSALISEGVSPGLIEKFSPISEEAATSLAYSSLCFNHSDVALGIVGVPPKDGTDGQIIISVCDESTYKIEKIDLKFAAGNKTTEEIATDKIINFLRLIIRDYPNNKGKKSIKLLLDEYAVDYVKKQKDKASPEVLAKRQKNLDLKGIYHEENTDNHKFKVFEKNPPKEKAQKDSGFFKNFLFYTVLVSCLLTLTVSIGYIGYYFKSSDNARELYDDIAKLHYGEKQATTSQITVPKGFPEDYDKSFIPLWEKNSDVVGFLKIETLGAENKPIISYPVVQKEGDKNKYYDRKDFEGNYSRYGVPFVDYESDVSLPSDNIIIYGHNMKDGQMFGCFENYNQADYMKNHPTIKFDSVYRKGEYAIFGVFYASTLPKDNPFNYHCFVKANSEEEYNAFVKEVKKRSLYNVNIDIDPTDELITLSTCVYKLPNQKPIDGGRFVLIGRKLRDGETASQISNLISQNKNPLMPAPYYRDSDTKTKAIKSVDIAENEINLNIGNKSQLSVAVTPKEADVSNLIWHSSDENVAKVFAGGLVEGVGTGSCVISACKEDGSVYDSVNVNVTEKTPNAVEKVVFERADETVRMGDSFKPSYETFPRDAQEKTVILQSDNPAIADVTENGEVFGFSVGRCAIKAFGSDGRFLGEMQVKVVSDYINVQSLSISSPDITLEIGKQTKLFLIINPLNATNADIVWESDNIDVCIVSNNGRVTAIAEGKAKITAKTKDGTKSDYINVTVKEGKSLIPVKEITSPAEITLSAGNTKPLGAKVFPVNASQKSLSYKSDNEEIATVSLDGKVTGISEGETNIIVSAENGSVTAITKVTVLPRKNLAKSIRFDNGTISLNPGEKTTLTVLCEPQDSELDLSFTSSNTDKLFVDKSGNITAKSSGVVTVTVTDKNTSLKSSCTVKIEEPVNTAVLQSINLSQSSVMLKKGETLLISYTLEPSTALNKDLVFSSSNKAVAEVSEDGLVKANGQGKATITVKAKEGKAKSTLQVNVLPDENDTQQSSDKNFRLSPSEIRLFAGEKAIITPKGITEKELKDAVWTSDNQDSVKVKGFSQSEDELGETGSYAEITAISEGIAKIKITLKSGKEAFTMIYVSKKPL